MLPERDSDLLASLDKGIVHCLSQCTLNITKEQRALSIYQTPHIGLTMTEMSLESLPYLIYVYVGTRSQGSVLQCLVKPTLRLLCFWLGCWLRWGFNIICLFICRCSLYLNRNNSILGMLLEPRIELLVWNTLVNTKGIN